MTRRKQLLRVYSQADWFAHLMLSTCIVAALNFIDILSVMAERAATAAEAARHGITVCFFGPPAPFYPRFFTLVALLVATPYSFKKTAASRLVASIGSSVALAAYFLWWFRSYHTLRILEEFAEVRALIDPAVEQFAYLYQGTPTDLAVALSTAVCLVLTLDRSSQRIKA